MFNCRNGFLYPIPRKERVPLILFKNNNNKLTTIEEFFLISQEFCSTICWNLLVFITKISTIRTPLPNNNNN